MGWLYGWWNRKSHVINPATGAGTDYPILLIVHYGSGVDSGGDVYCNSKCKTDFGDLRFTKADGTSFLWYSIEEQVSGNYAKVWVRIADDLSTNPVTIYIYYGNPDALSMSNPYSTLLFFDDFSGTEIDQTKWTWTGETPTVADGLLKLIGKASGQCKLTGKHSISCPFREVAKMKWSHHQPSVYGMLSGIQIDPPKLDGIGIRADGPADKISVYGYSFLGYASTPSTNVPYDPTVFREWMIHYYPEGTHGRVDAYEDGTFINNQSYWVVPTSAQAPYLEAPFQVGKEIDIDWIYIRKYVSPEPTNGTWGIEEIFGTIELTQYLKFSRDMIEPSEKVGYWILNYWVRKVRPKRDKTLADDHNIPRLVFRRAKDIEATKQ